jgi:hypothetical protein
MDHGSRDSCPPLRLGAQHFQGFSSAQTQRAVVAASLQARRLLQFSQKSSNAQAYQSPRVLVLAAKIWVDAVPIYRDFCPWIVEDEDSYFFYLVYGLNPQRTRLKWIGENPP